MLMRRMMLEVRMGRGAVEVDEVHEAIALPSSSEQHAVERDC